MNALTDNLTKQNIVKAYGAVPGDQQADFHALNNTITDNIAVLQAALDNCRETPEVTSCQSATDSALAQLTEVNVDI